MSNEASDEGEDVEIVAERMADAILYLCDVAKRAGLESVSDDLMSVRQKLTASGQTPSLECNLATTEARKASGGRK